MKALAELHYDEISKIEGINWERIRACKFLHEFDRELQGPTWGYPTEGAYYRDATSVDALLEAKIPVFIINATDDPVSGVFSSVGSSFANSDTDCLQCCTSLS